MVLIVGCQTTEAHQAYSAWRGTPQGKSLLPPIKAKPMIPSLWLRNEALCSPALASGGLSVTCYEFWFKGGDELPSSYAILARACGQTMGRPGSKGADALVDPADPAHILLVTGWSDGEARAGYSAWRRTPEGASLLPPFVSRPGKRVEWELDDSL